MQGELLNTGAFTWTLGRRGFPNRSYSPSFARVSNPTMKCSIVLTLLCLIALFSGASAKLTRASCFGNDCIQNNWNETLCHYPDNASFPRPGRCVSQPLSDLVEAHIAAGDSDAIPSIAYYNVETGNFLGGSAWTVHSWPQGRDAGLIALCSTGHLHGDAFQTTCRFASEDEDFGVAAAHNQECTRVHGHDERVIQEKCCGPPRSVCPPSKREVLRGHGGGFVRWLLAAATVGSTISAILWTRSERVRNPRD